MSAVRLDRVLAALIVAATCAACAHPNPEHRGTAVWQLRGSIVSVDQDSLRVRHKSGQIVEIAIDDETSFVRDDLPVPRSALHAGVRVQIDVEPRSGERQRARRVRVFGGA